MRFNYKKNVLVYNKKSYNLDEINQMLIDKAYNYVKNHLITVKMTRGKLEPLIDWKHLHSMPEIQMLIINYTQWKK
jgi:hypothetical protein